MVDGVGDALHAARGVVVAVALLSAPACVVSERCFEDKDCARDQRCSTQGRCVATSTGPDMSVPDGRVPIRCPLPNMVPVADLFCIDIYEASRPDATASDEGVSAGRAVNRKGVLPWQGVGLATARAACKAAGKRLCGLGDWRIACEGPDKTTYSYGNTYHPTICNGIDTHCDCSAPGCAAKSPCPYAHCFSTCGAAFTVEPTGFRSGCQGPWGVFDINGNVWELTDTQDSLEHFRGGAYNCMNSEALHRCDHDGSWGPSARGFRCCADGVPVTVDAGPNIDAQVADTRSDTRPVDIAHADLHTDLEGG